jgi:PAS domain S-box-containing protein
VNNNIESAETYPDSPDVKEASAATGRESTPSATRQTSKKKQSKQDINNLAMLRAELQETRDKYLLLYDFSPNGYLTLNSAGRILEANLTISAMLGIDKSSLPGEFFYKFLTAGSRNLFEPHLKAVLNGALKGEIEIRLKRKDGSHLPVKVESIAVRDSRGILSQCYLTITDISQIKKTQELERLHKTVMELSGQAVFVTNRNLQIIEWNKVAQRYFGWEAYEISLPTGSAHIRNKILEPLINNEMMQCLTENGSWSGPVTCPHKDGSKHQYRVSIGVIWDDSGNFNGLTAIFESDSEQRAAIAENSPELLESLVKERTEDLMLANRILQQELTRYKQLALADRESEGKNNDLVNNIKLGIFRCTPGSRGKFLEINRAMEEMSDYTREELLNLEVCTLLKNDEPDTPFNNEYSITDWKVTRELTLQKKSGDTITVAVTVVAIRYESGSTLYFDGIIEDITERKQAQKQIQDSVLRLQKTVKEIIEAMAYIGEVRDPYTAGHQRRVAQLSMAIGKAMGLNDEQIEGLTMASFVHDIGKILVPADILSKPGKLTKPELDMLRDHPRIGHEILKTIEFPWPIADIVLQHHERINGSGYPFGLTGDRISIEARILAVADVVEAMSSHRPYRPALGIDKALEEISLNRGILYDSLTVDCCIALFKEQGYSLS